MTAAITAADISASGTAAITVVNPTPGGGTSNSLTFTITDFSVTATTTSQTVTAGQPANFTIATATVGGAFPGTVTFTASGLPTGASASFSHGVSCGGKSDNNDGDDDFRADWRKLIFHRRGPNNSAARPDVDIYVGDAADDCVCTRKRGEAESAQRGDWFRLERFCVAADFSWIYQRMLGQWISEDWIEQRNSGGNLLGYCDGNFGK